MSTISGKDTQVLQCYSTTVKKRGRKMLKKNSIYLYKYIEVFLWYVDGKIELQHCNTATLLALCTSLKKVEWILL